MTTKQGIWKRLAPMALTQFLGVFNDHAFKMVIVLTAVGALQSSYSSNAAFIAIATIVYVLPFVLFAGAAGYMADKFAKRNVLVLAKFSELVVMLLGALCLYQVKSWGVIPLIGVMFLMAGQSAFFSPSFNGFLPEIFSEKDLSKANGNVGMVTFIAVICGAGGGFLLRASVGDALYMCGLVFSLLSLIGFLGSLMIVRGKPANRARQWNWNFLWKYIEGFNYIRKRRPLYLAVLGDAYFVAFGTALQGMLVVYGVYSLGIPKDNFVDIGLLQLAPALGMGLGCYLAGRLSGGKVELGLVPFGGAGFVIFLILTAWFPGEVVKFGEYVKEGVTHYNHHLYPRVLFFLGALGVSGGLFVIPLRAYQQQKTDPENRGTVLANANVICFGAILLAGLSMFYFTSGTKDPEAAKVLGGFIFWIQSHCLSLDPIKILLGMGVLTFLICIYLFWLLPVFALRFAIVILTNTLYKLKVTGAENLPERGPAFLVANHVSFVDGLLITACSSRIVHFMMHQDYYRYPLLYPLVKWMGFIEVPRPDSPKKLIKMFEKSHEALRRGEVVCVFPEGKLTTNGLMDEFKKGINRMIPDDLEVPIIPVRLGMIWGSIFSYYYGKIKLRFPSELPYPATVTFGKPVSKDILPFQLWQTVSQLAEETEEQPRDRERPLHYQVAKMAKRRPFRKVVVDFEGQGVNNFTLLLKAILVSREVRKMVPDDREYVGVLLPNTTTAAIVTLGVMMADKVPAMINFTASKQAMEAMIEKADINCILTSKMFVKKANLEELPEMVFLEDAAKKITKSQRLVAALQTIFLPHQELMNLVAPKSHRDVFRTAVLLFSSGSTGSPKGVLLSHHNVNSNVYSFLRIVGWSRKDRLMGNLPLFHSFGMLTNFWVPMMSQCQIVYIPNPLDGAAIGKAIETHKLTILLATPTFLQSYMRKCTPEQLKTLRLVIVGAEKMRSDITEKFREMTGLEVIEGYGCTELSPVVSINVSNSILDLGVKSGRLDSIGPPIPGVCVKIVNPDTREELPPNTEGLMLVKGPNVMQGYLKDPEKTAEVIQDGWYNTGDIAKMNVDGYLTITGRLSRFSKIGGEMVPHELVEKEINEIIRTDERSIAVCGVPDTAKGEKLVILYTELPVSPDDIVEKLRKKEIPNLWIPKTGNFHQVDELPLLGSGKLDLGAVNKKALEVTTNA